MEETALEKVLVSFNKQSMIAHLDSYPEDFEQAVNLALCDKQPYSWRAAWLLFNYMQPNDTRIKPYISDIIGFIGSGKEGQQRELIKILMKIKLKEDHEGLLFDACVSTWEKISNSPALRYYALKMIYRIAANYPELLNEIGFLTRDHYLETLTPGIRRGIVKMIEENHRSKDSV